MEYCYHFSKLPDKRLKLQNLEKRFLEIWKKRYNFGILKILWLIFEEVRVNLTISVKVRLGQSSLGNRLLKIGQ